MSRIQKLGKLNYCRRVRNFLVFFCVSFLTLQIFLLTDENRCEPEKYDTSIVNRTDHWRYRNSVTGQWFNWTITFETPSSNFSWPMKWLNSAPKSYLGVIVYLATVAEVSTLKQSFTEINQLFERTGRPVVVFHEGDFDDENIQLSLAQILGPNIPLSFEQIKFSDDSLPIKVQHIYPKGYLHMCRFFTIMIFNHPVLSLFSMFLRLDTHSYIFSPTPIDDPFDLMKEKQLDYAFVMANIEDAKYDYGLWSLFHNFLNRNCLKRSKSIEEVLTGWFGMYSEDIIFTNFAITNVSLWRENEMLRAWLNVVDLDGGIYQYRWGDAPIHTLALAQFVEPNKIARLRYFGYWHRREYVCSSGTPNDVCQQQVAKYKTNRKRVYLTHKDGCFIPKRKFCHYYQEIHGKNKS